VHSAIHYPIAPHHQRAYEKELGHLRLPLTEALHREVVSLPVSPVMTDEQVDFVISSINRP
jgi:dTDP-4-amino-4,6-dideoxygalactose transaminase